MNTNEMSLLIRVIRQYYELGYSQTQIADMEHLSKSAVNRIIKKAKANAEKDGRYLSVITSVCGTEEDPQSLSKTQQQLRDAGAVVMPTNSQATRLVERIISNIK